MTPKQSSLGTLINHRSRLRVALYLFILVVASPIRYWPLEDNIDATWRFALNYAHAQGLVSGVDTVFTSGPLGYLMFPQHVGTNLTQGLMFQAALWLALAAILWDVFFRGGFPLRNLALFSFWLCLAAPLFWFDYVGQENLMLAGALFLLVMFHLHGSWTRYLAALVLLGLLPLFKLTAGMIGCAALAGFLLHRVFRMRARAIPSVALAAVVPVTVVAVAYRLVLPSFPAFLTYLRGAVEIVNGFSSAMSAVGAASDFAFALEALAILAFLLLLPSLRPSGTAAFYAALFILPLAISFKHGFVRHDQHIVSFFCFVALCLSICSLTVKLSGKTVTQSAFVMTLFLLIWQACVWRPIGRVAVIQSTGLEAAQMLWGAARFAHLPERLDRISASLPEESRLEPELASIIGTSPVGSLSFDYVNLAAAHLNLQLYPVIQRYAAYTPYLDDLNAAWIKDKGPRFLVFDGRTLDTRDGWAESPATWAEVYRWYKLNALGPRNMLLERLSQPRFSAFTTIGSYSLRMPGELRFPASTEPVFWTMNCEANLKGKLERLFFGIPEVVMSVHQTNGLTRPGRIIPELLVSPVMGNFLAGTLVQFAAIFRPETQPTDSVDTLRFGGPGLSAYSSMCRVQILRAVQ